MKMKRIISVVTAIAMIATLSTGTAFAGQGQDKNGGSDKGNGSVQKQYKEFKDMKGHWGYNSVQKMQSYGIFDGYDDGTFRPDQALSEGELAVIIARMLEERLGADEDQDIEDEDLNDDSDNDDALADVPGWAKDAVSKGFQKNYLNLKRFHSQVQCNRLTACVAIAKALDLEPVTDFTNNPFKDRGLISDEDFGYLLALYEAGYINGYPDGNFNPNNLLTRAQMASIIEKLMSELEDGDVDSDDDTAPNWDNDDTVTATAIRATGVDLKWSAASDDVGVTGYKVIYELDGEDKVKYVSDKTATISGLEADEEYTFTVEAKDAAGNWSDDGPSVEVITADQDEEEDTEEPYWDNDSELTASAINTDSVTLKWPAAHDDTAVVGYKVIYEVDGVEKEKSVTGRNVTIKGLEADVEYTFTVEAKDAAGNWSDDGPSLDVTTLEEAEQDEAAPTWPSGAALQVSPSSSGVVTLIWPDAEDNTGVTAYKIYKDGQLIQTVDDDVNNCNVTGLEEDQEYTFKVRAADEAGNLSSSLTKTYLY